MVSVSPVYSPTEEAAQPPMKPPQERKERLGAVTSRLGQAVLTSSLLCSTPGPSHQNRAVVQGLNLHNIQSEYLLRQERVLF